jgi:hypothetical protein
MSVRESTFHALARWTWVMSWGRGERLHALAVIGRINSDDDTQASGITACGRKGIWGLPGIFSRMDMPRCLQCSRKLGWPPGDGSPKNAPALRALVERTP